MMTLTARNKPRTLLACIVVLLLGAMAAPPRLAADSAQHIRQPAVAGSFYPKDPSELAATVDKLIAQANISKPEGQIVALIAPHAGYPFSGAVAAHSYALIKGTKLHRVVVIAPSHFEAFRFSSVYDGDAYVTPLGRVPVDKQFANKLANSSPLIKLSSRGHEPSERQAEHALEVQLPFLQRSLPEFQLVPVIMGDQSYEASRALGVALAELIQGTDTLMVVSSDLSHYHTYEQASNIDRKTVNAIQEWDYLTLSKNFETRTWEACGGGPIVAAMIAAERLGANRAVVLKYSNTGDITGDHKRVVGYAAVALLRNAAQPSTREPPLSLSGREKRQLLDIARKSVESAVKENKLLQISEDLPTKLAQDRGAFVTIRKHGGLRGCVGYTSASQSLALTVRDVAALAALRDPRFPPVAVNELSQLQYEVSVLSPFHQVSEINKIRPGEHGLLMKNGPYEGLLLPQVASEERWDRKMLLEQTALKAGLRANAWKDKDTDIFMFSALVFGESPPSTALNPEVPFSQKPTSRPGDQGQDLPRR